MCWGGNGGVNMVKSCKSRLFLIKQPAFAGPRWETRTPDILLPNNLEKLFPVVSNGFQSFPFGFTYSLDLFEPAFSGCSGAVCGHLCGQKRFPPQTGDFSPAQDGKHFAFQVGWIVTLSKRLFKCFLPRAQLKVCGAINKEKSACFPLL